MDIKPTAFKCYGKPTFYEWESGQVIENFEGICVVYGIDEPWKFKTWTENGERAWQAIGRA